MTDWADELTTKLLDNTPELKHVTLREIMAMALRDERISARSAERARCLEIASRRIAKDEALLNDFGKGASVAASDIYYDIEDKGEIE